MDGDTSVLAGLRADIEAEFDSNRFKRTVCVTGANGFIAGHTVAQLLAQGFDVHGTVRDPSSPQHDYLKKLPGGERLTLFRADLTEPGSFDEAVVGCEYVFHMASPVVLLHAVDPDLVVGPAKNGTLAVLEACRQAHTVKRVVMTSSFATVIFGHDHTTDSSPYTDKEWNNVSKPSPGDTANIYRFSKVAAERAAWEFMDTHSPKFDLVTLNPPMVIGSWLPGYTRPNDSSIVVRNYMSGVAKVAAGGMGWVDVHDVAQAHIATAMQPKANGRYIVVNESLMWMEVADILRELFPAEQYPHVRVSSVPPQRVHLKPEFDISRTVEELHFKPSRTVRQSLLEQGQALIDAGLLDPKANTVSNVASPLKADDDSIELPLRALL